MTQCNYVVTALISGKKERETKNNIMDTSVYVDLEEVSLASLSPHERLLATQVADLQTSINPSFRCEMIKLLFIQVTTVVMLRNSCKRSVLNVSYGDLPKNSQIRIIACQNNPIFGA